MMSSFLSKVFRTTPIRDPSSYMAARTAAHQRAAQHNYFGSANEMLDW